MQVLLKSIRTRVNTNSLEKNPFLSSYFHTFRVEIISVGEILSFYRPFNLQADFQKSGWRLPSRSHLFMPCPCIDVTPHRHSPHKACQQPKHWDSLIQTFEKYGRKNKQTRLFCRARRPFSRQIKIGSYFYVFPPMSHNGISIYCIFFKNLESSSYENQSRMLWYYLTLITNVK